METSTVQSIKLIILSVVGLSKDALHVYVGLAVFLAAALVLRKPLHAFLPWFAVCLAAIAGEALDAFDDLRSLGHWRVGASVHDILNTLFWPTVLSLLSRFSRRFRVGRFRTGDRENQTE
jgi:hypothetical protein